MQLPEHPLGGLARIGALSPREYHGEIRCQVAVASVPGTLQHELDSIGTES
jgi:hypothetical protein